MTKVIVLALAFTVIVAFASAYTTTVRTTTTTNDQFFPSSKDECSQELQRESFDMCQMYLEYQDQNSQEKEIRQQCCNELERVDNQCQCEAVKQVFWEAQKQMQQQQEQQGGSSPQQIQQILRLITRAEQLPNKCNLKTNQCQIRPIITTTTTTIITDNLPRRSQPQQCRQIQGQRFNKCQRYIEQQSGSFSRSLLMSINKQEQEQELKQCCNELQNVDNECQCEAMIEIYRQSTQQQQQQQPQGSHERRRGEDQQRTERQVRRIVENLPDRCNLNVDQCQIPSSMF